MSWVCTKCKMPGKGIDVLVYCADTREQFVAFSLGNGHFQFAQQKDGTAIVCRPSHWQSLIAAPE
jgi:hypothetical protein